MLGAIEQRLQRGVAGPAEDLPYPAKKTMGASGRRLAPEGFEDGRICRVCGVLYFPRKTPGATDVAASRDTVAPGDGGVMAEEMAEAMVLRDTLPGVGSALGEEQRARHQSPVELGSMGPECFGGDEYRAGESPVELEVIEFGSLPPGFREFAKRLLPSNLVEDRTLEQRLTDGEEPTEEVDYLGCTAVGVGGMHSEEYGDPHDGVCQWCGMKRA
jgi:hypothetical protein